MTPSTLLPPPSLPRTALIGNDLAAEWPFIRWHFRRCIVRNGHISLATTPAQGWPGLAPVGSLVLLDGMRGYYLEKFTGSVERAGGEGSPLTVMGADTGRWFWLKSLYRGRFGRPPGVRLYGVAGARRPATAEEKDRFLKLVRPLRRLKGYDMLWADMAQCREIEFVGAEYVRLGKMAPLTMSGNWPQSS